MSNRLTTWELKAVDNLPEVIKRMEQIASLLQQQQQLSASSSSAITKQLSDITSGYNSLVKSMDAVLKEQQANTQAAKDASAASQAAVSASVRASNELRAAKEAERKQLQEIKAQYDAMKSSVTTLGTLIGITFSASQIRQFLVDVIDANTRINLFSKSLEIMLQNKKQADEIAAYALNLSTRSTLDVKQIIEVTQRLVAMGAESGKVNTYLEMLGELSSVVGTHKLPLIAKALLDVQNKQKLYAQEVRQFTDNGIPLFQLLAESMDLPIKKVKQLADDHKITFEDVEKALLKATQEGGKYYGMMALQAESLGGSLKNLSDRVFLAMARFGEFVKDGLGAAIKAAGNFIESMTGTNAQMQRTIDIVKSVTSAIVAFTVSSRAAAVVVAAKELVMRAYTIAVGTTHLAMQGLTAAIGANMTITTAAANTARAFWATLASNPIGLVIAAVGLATSAYYAYRAATSEANEATHVLNNRIAEAQAPLELVRTEFNRLAKEVLSSKASVEEKTKALEKLKDKYPQQMKGIEDLADAEKKLGALMKEVNNDFLIRIKLLENEVRTAVNNEAAKAAIREKIKLEGELATASTERAKIYGTAGKMEVYSDAEVLKSRIDKLNTTIVQAQKFNDNIAFQSARLTKEIREDWTEQTKKGVEDTGKAIEEGEKKKKDKAVLTAKEIAEITKRAQVDSFKDQLALIDAHAEVEKERVNHTKISKKQAEEAITEIVRKAEAEKAALRKKYSDMMLASTKETDSEAAISSKELAEVLKFDMKEVEKEKKKTEAEKRKENKQTHQEWEQYQRDVQRLTKETAKIEEDARRDGIKMAMDYLSAQGGVFGELGRVARKAFDDIDLINGKTVDSYAKTLKAAQENAESTARIFGAGSEQYNQSRVQVAEANKNLSEAQAAMGKAKAGLIMMVAEVIEGLKNMYFQGIVETNKAIVDSMLRTRDIVKQYYNDIVRANQENLKAELEAFRGTHEEKIRMMREFYAEQKRLSEDRDVIDNQITFNARMLEINTETTSKISSAWDLSKGPLGPQQLFKVLMTWKEHNAQMEAAELQREARAQQLRQQRIQEEVDAARQIRDANIEAIRERAEAERDALEKRIDEIQKAADAEEKMLKKSIESSKDDYRKQVDIVKQAYGDQVDALKEKHRLEKDAYNEQVDAVKDAYSRELDALREKQSAEKTALQELYDFKRSQLEQATADETEAIAIVDRLRNEAVERYRVDEVARLTATRDRILANLTDEAERASVMDEYARQIQAVHDEVEQAKLDKSKGVSLATKQLRQEEKDESTRLKNEEKTELERLDDEYQAKFKELAAERDAKLEEMSLANKEREKEQKAELAKLEEEHDAKLKKMSEDQYAREQFLQKQITQLETDTATKIQILKQEIANKDKQTKDAMLFENQKYRDFVIQANKEMLESQKAMAIAQLQAEIAILRGKKNIFNSGRINAAIGDIEQAIRDLEGIGSTPMDFGNAVAEKIKNAIIIQLKANKTPFDSETLQVVNEAYDRDGNVIQLTYTDEDRQFIAYDKNKNAFKVRNATGFVEKTGETFYKGTPYVEGLSYPDGIDTVPAMVNKGERILPDWMNERIGGKQLSNEALEQKVLFADSILNRVASIRQTLTFDKFFNPFPMMPISSTPQADLDALADKIAAAVNANSTSINVTPFGMSVKEKSRMSQNITYYENTVYNKRQ